MQQGDVLLQQTDDNGDITVTGGVVELSPGLETAAYLSLFGGNEDDDGRDGNPTNWWGNLNELDPDRRYRSETQYLLNSLPATTGNLRRIEDAARRDLSWFDGEVSVAASMPGVNRVKLTIDIVLEGDAIILEYVERWGANQ